MTSTSIIFSLAVSLLLFLYMMRVFRQILSDIYDYFHHKYIDKDEHTSSTTHHSLPSV